MHLDPSAYLRIEAHQSIETSAFGASFATSSGDILEVSSFGEGVFRMRMGPAHVARLWNRPAERGSVRGRIGH
jgi:hypothetical protein